MTPSQLVRLVLLETTVRRRAGVLQERRAMLTVGCVRPDSACLAGAEAPVKLVRHSSVGMKRALVQ